MTEHPYPSNYRPGTHWAVDEAWEILDRLPVGMLPDDHRFLIAGMITGALLKSQQKRSRRAGELITNPAATLMP